MKKEINTILSKYFPNEENTIRLENSKEEEKRFNDCYRFFEGIISYDAPDMYNKIENDVLIVEHFEFDASIRSKKGSQYRQNESRVNSKFNHLLNSLKKGNINHSCSIKHECSAEKYINNLKHNFNQHYAKIDSYINNLKTKGIIKETTKTKICFFIEDVTCLGSYVLEKGQPKSIVLLYIKQFLDLLDNSPKVDYIFYGGFNGNTDWLWFMSRENIIEFRNKEIDLDTSEFFYFPNPQSIAFATIIDKRNVTK